MEVKSIIAFCASALLVQSAQSSCVGKLSIPYNYAGCGYNGLAAPALLYDSFSAPTASGLGCGYTGVASTGGGLPCASTSSISPAGISVLSENVYEGRLSAGGNLPFLGSVGVGGVLPTSGAGAVSYGCGNSRCAVSAEEGSIATGIAPHAPGSYSPFAGYTSAVSGYKGYGVGCGSPYNACCGTSYNAGSGTYNAGFGTPYNAGFGTSYNAGCGYSAF